MQEIESDFPSYLNSILLNSSKYSPLTQHSWIDTNV